VRKILWDGSAPWPGRRRGNQPFVFSGLWPFNETELPGSGYGCGHGNRESGRSPAIGRDGTDSPAVETPAVRRAVAVVGLALCALVVVFYGINMGDWVHGLLAGITLAMACCREFPVVLTIFSGPGRLADSKTRF